MRIPRMTTRRWLAAMATVALSVATWLCAERRRDYFTSLAEWHHDQIHDPPMSPRQQRFSIWHRDLSVKYRRAARYPWLPVAPDPTPPE